MLSTTRISLLFSLLCYLYARIYYTYCVLYFIFFILKCFITFFFRCILCHVICKNVVLSLCMKIKDFKDECGCVWGCVDVCVGGGGGGGMWVCVCVQCS